MCRMLVWMLTQAAKGSQHSHDSARTLLGGADVCSSPSRCTGPQLPPPPEPPPAAIQSHEESVLGRCWGGSGGVRWPLPSLGSRLVLRRRPAVLRLATVAGAASGATGGLGGRPRRAAATAARLKRESWILERRVGEHSSCAVN